MGKDVNKNNIDFNEPFLTGEMETSEKDWELLEKMVEDFYKAQGVSKKTLEHFVVHNKQVKDFVIKFSKEENFNKREREIVILSAILHDVAKGFENFELHGEKGGEIAQEVLLKIGKSLLLAQSVKIAIIRHMGEEGYPARMAKKKYGDDFKYPKPATIVGQMLYECDILTQLTPNGFAKLLHLRKTNKKDITDDKETALRGNITQEDAALFSVLRNAEESYNLIKIESIKKFADSLWQEIQKNMEKFDNYIMKLNIKKIKEDAKKDFEKTWVDTAKLLPRKTEVKIKKARGKEHIFRKTVARLRQIFLDMGFDETENLTILPAEDVYREYGPEAAAILDRVFYLAKLPRPDIGLSKEKILQIKKLIGKFSEAKLKEIFRDYKKGKIESDDLVEEMVKKMKIKTEQATGIISLFSEFKKLKPEITDLTLRSHITGTWYHTLAAIQNKKDFPIALFSLGLRYRNEQKEDPSHLRVHYSASIVIMDSEMSMEAGEKIVKQIIDKLGFKGVKFEKKQATSKYYAADQEKEVFVKHNNKWLELGDIGMYSPISLANFGIEYPVFNVGFGIERLAMVLENYNDIREMMYPQFYSSGKFSDKEVANSIYIIEKPSTDAGKEIAKAVKNIAKKYKDKIAPIEFIAWKGKVNSKKVKVIIIEPEQGQRLIGPAGFNKIIVKGNNIVGIDKASDGVLAKFDYMDGLCNKIASDIENKKKSFEYRVRAIRSLTDINLDIPKDIKNYIKANHKKIDIKGPVFMTIKVEIT